MPNFKKIAYEIRLDIIKMVANAQSGHLASALGLSDLFSVLYFSQLKHDPKKSKSKDRDWFLMSNGHACAVWYASLAKAGYFSKSELMKFRKIDSPLQGHPHINSLPGIENTSGSLGQGLSLACGVALGLRIDRKRNQVFCLISDGELDEGQTYEAFMLANKYKLGNLIAIIDRNHIQIEGKTHDVMPTAMLTQKLNSFGWSTMTVDGHDNQSLIETIQTARQSFKPTAIIMHTTPGKGVSFMENDYHWHGKVPSEHETEKAIKELDEVIKNTHE